MKKLILFLGILISVNCYSQRLIDLPTATTYLPVDYLVLEPLSFSGNTSKLAIQNFFKDVVITDSLIINGNINISGTLEAANRVSQYHRQADISTSSADTWETVKFDTLILSESTKGFDFDDDSTYFVVDFDGIIRVQGCGHWEWAGGISDAKMYIRTLINSTEARCLQANDDKAFKSGDDGMLGFIGTIAIEATDTIRIQYQVSSTDIDWSGSAVFDNAVSFSVNFEQIAKKE